MDTGLVPLYNTLEVVKSLAPLNVKGHGKSTVPETSAKVYGVWCTPMYSEMYCMRGVNSI